MYSTGPPSESRELILLERTINATTSPDAALSALTGELRPSTLLRAMAGTSEWLARAADSSHRHDNGFDKIVIYGQPIDSTKVVLHVWRNSPESNHTDNIHNHRWDFASVVLCGRVRTELYDDDPVGTTYPMMRYQSPGSGSSYTITASGERTVASRAVLTLAPGSEYLWHKDLLHRAWGVGAPLTATLIVQGRPQRTTTTVLDRSATSVGDPTSRPVHRLGVEEIARTLSTVVESMSS